MFSAEIQAKADARNDEGLAMVLKIPSLKPHLDMVGMEIACELAMAGPGLRKDRLRRILREHFAERFALGEYFGFENTG